MRILGFLDVSALLSGVMAAGPSPADFQLRVRIFQVNQNSHYSGGNLNYVDGEGRANLFENSEPHGLDFGYRCGQRLRVSAGYETYPARWKKPGRQLEILLPVMGKPGVMSACELKVDMKETVYFRHNGLLNEEPGTVFKDWMQKHDYDPEHGKNMPVFPSPPSNATAPAEPKPQ
jgi:hypothetical protein